MKGCKSCGEERPLSEYHKKKAQADGLHYYCKPCNNAMSSEWQKNNREKSRGIKSRWRNGNMEKHLSYNKAYREANKARRAANNKLQYAVMVGNIKRQSCEACDSIDTHGHHDDYTKPLDVRWLCSLHHAAVHAGGVEGNIFVVNE